MLGATDSRMDVDVGCRASCGPQPAWKYDLSNPPARQAQSAQILVGQHAPLAVDARPAPEWTGGLYCSSPIKDRQTGERVELY